MVPPPYRRISKDIKNGLRHAAFMLKNICDAEKKMLMTRSKMAKWLSRFFFWTVSSISNLTKTRWIYARQHVRLSQPRSNPALTEKRSSLEHTSCSFRVEDVAFDVAFDVANIRRNSTHGILRFDARTCTMSFSENAYGSLLKYFFSFFEQVQISSSPLTTRTKVRFMFGTIRKEELGSHQLQVAADFLKCARRPAAKATIVG